jgi:WD40 repeat protein
LQWVNAGHAAIDTLNVRDRTLVDATWLSPQKIALSTVGFKRQSTPLYRSYSLSRHGIDVDLRQPRFTQSISSPPLPSGTGLMDSDGSTRFAICCRDQIIVCEMGNPAPIATCPRPPGKRVAFHSACLLHTRFLVVAMSQEIKAEETEDGETEPAVRLTSLLLIDLRNGEELHRQDFPGLASISRLKLTPDGRRVMGAVRDGKMISIPLRWDAAHADSRPSFGTAQLWKAHWLAAVHDFVFFSDDQGRLATVGDDGTCAIWTVEDDFYKVIADSSEEPVTPRVLQSQAQAESEPKPDLRLLVSSGPVTRVTASSRGDRLATVGEDRVIRIWDSRNGLELISLAQRKEAVVALEFSPDDRFLMIAEANTRIEVIELTNSTSE